MIIMLLKFGLVGLTGIGINMAVYVHLITLGADYLVASGCSFGVAVTNNFIWNLLWTFRGRAQDKSIINKYISFFALSALNLGVNLFVLQLLVKYFRFNATTAQLFAIGVASSLNFTFNHLVTFGEKPIKQGKDGPLSYENNYHTNLQ